MMMMSKSFKGANVFMSRNLVPPEVFDSLHDALKQNGAQVYLCCDPSRSGPDDFHVISSPEHDRFEHLRAKGCHLLGPQCVLTCAKENRPLPKNDFTCCLAMDGVKVLASGFEMDEKVKIGKMVVAMGGILSTKATMDVNFVIAKNVLAAKYKWAINYLKKPVLTMDWLYQCWKEHRVVPQETFRIPPFSGLTICVTRIRAACLNEESYPVQGGSGSVKGSLAAKPSHEKGLENSQSVPSTAADSNLQSVTCSGFTGSDLEATLSQNFSSTYFDNPVFIERDESGGAQLQPKSETNLDGCVADDSQNEDNDLYLVDCKISIVGFEASEMRKLVSMVRSGGGSRCVSFDDKLTHIIVGNPSESEKKEIRALAALGVIHVVIKSWLEECDHQRKEIPVVQRHIAYDLLLPKDSICSNKGAVSSMPGMKQGKSYTHQSDTVSDLLQKSTDFGSGISFDKNKEAKLEISRNGSCSSGGTGRPSQSNLSSDVNDNYKRQQQKIECNTNIQSMQNKKSASVFRGKTFCFSISFPEDRKAEIVQWVNEGGGAVVDDHEKQNVRFIIECHGVVSKSADSCEATKVSSHWIRSCLEDGCLLDVKSHILYTPLSCQIPFPGFGSFRFCVSQYEEKDRLLLRNLCFVLGAKFVEKLTKKVTHLLCKFANGPKYEAACKWGIQPVTSEWLYECVKQDKVVPPSPFYPKEVTSADREAGMCTMSQYPTQAVRMISGDTQSQFQSQSQDRKSIPSPFIFGKSESLAQESKCLSNCSKRARLIKDDSQEVLLPTGENKTNSVSLMHSNEKSISEAAAEVFHVVPDVAAAIEDLLEQTSKIHDMKTLETAEGDKTFFSSDCSILRQDHNDAQSAFSISKHWIDRTRKKSESGIPSADASSGMYDGFSETQTDSQVVGYEEDLSGRQMIIDRET
ncbi:BRCT domain [Dillenia turbinata]|uniref:BRCT domain n=1 Tax=Dillenia turbinata TaxID=194707 RepID=A0AAN8VRR0_9MAGN